MENTRHVFIVAGEPKSGINALKNLVKDSKSALVIDGFQFPDERKDIPQSLINQLDSADPSWRDKVKENSNFVLFIIIDEGDSNEVIRLMDSIYPTVFKDNNVNSIAITILNAEDGDFYL